MDLYKLNSKDNPKNYIAQIGATKEGAEIMSKKAKINIFLI
jgi:hypothetical protein